jgi:hypothetical protein
MDATLHHIRKTRTPTLILFYTKNIKLYVYILLIQNVLVDVTLTDIQQRVLSKGLNITLKSIPKFKIVKAIESSTYC